MYQRKESSGIIFLFQTGLQHREVNETKLGNCTLSTFSVELVRKKPKRSIE